MFCCCRAVLSHDKKLRRSYYEVLRDQMDLFVLDYSLLHSYQNFLDQNLPYPFVEIRELKPRARIPNTEFKHQNSFLVIFSESSLNANHKKYVRYFDANKTTKTNLIKNKYFSDVDDFHNNLKYMETPGFYNLMKNLLPVDYALLIQPDARARKSYALTHVHVRIDWPIADAAEHLAKYLRYISRDLYEKGDKYAETIQNKFFEYYGMPVMAGGRRTAAIVAAQYFRKIGIMTTVYVGSSESRALLRIDENGISKAVLVKFSREEIRKIADIAGFNMERFLKNYVIAKDNRKYVCIFNVYYTCSVHALPSEGGRLRECKTDSNWLSVSLEQILPKPSVHNCPPVPFKIIYS
ncbi:MAG: hypothetical protein U9P10_14850 [Thermodesulfobacteriota bacterium]|nr:hypothetical protein [Thermodesulfobacteriota bacterium]